MFAISNRICYYCHKYYGKTAYCILAVENEDKINYAMPVKDGLYDFLQLAKQVNEIARSHKEFRDKGRKPSADEYLSGFWKDDKLYPVITVVVYYGADRWTTAEPERNVCRLRRETPEICCGLPS